MAQKKFSKRVIDTLKNGGASALVLYPSMKLTWAADSAARNVLPAGVPQEARTPAVGLLLSLLPQMFGSNYWTDKASEMLMASALVQTAQQAGNKGTGLPGPLDTTVNKVFMPLANLGAGTTAAEGGTSGYAVKRGGANGYAVKRGGAAGYSLGRGGRMGMDRHPNDMAGSQLRKSMRGFQSEYR